MLGADPTQFDADTALPPEFRHVTVRLWFPTPHPIEDWQRDHADTDQAHTVFGHGNRLHAVVFDGIVRLAFTHSAESTIAFAASRQVTLRTAIPKLTSLPFIQGEEQGLHGSLVHEYDAFPTNPDDGQRPVLHCCSCEGATRPAPAHAEPSSSTAPSTKHVTDRKLQPSQRAEQTDQSPVTYVMWWTMGAFTGYAGLGVGVILLE